MKTMKKAVFLILILSFFFNLIPSAQAAPVFYYAYGDSITAWPNCYILQMVNTFNPTAGVNRNTDGNGQSTAWALANLPAHYNSQYTVFVIEFGVNDRKTDTTAQNLIQIYNSVKANGSTPFILIPTLRLANGDSEYDYANQSERITVLQNTLDVNEIPYVKMYDAIDTIPNNGQLNDFNCTNYVDIVHPNDTGHRLMAEYLWKYLNLHPPVTKQQKIGIYNSFWSLDYNGNGIWDGPAFDQAFRFGKSGDIPVIGDWNGNNVSDVGVFRESTGYWYIDTTKDGIEDIAFRFGKTGDVPVVGDWNGDGTTDAGVFRPSVGTWYLDTTKTGEVNMSFLFGKTGDVPVVGDWNGDGTTDAGVFRPSVGTWYLDSTKTGEVNMSFLFGKIGDVPVVGDWNGDGTADAGVFRPSVGTWYLDSTKTGEVNMSFRFGKIGDVPVVGDWN